MVFYDVFVFCMLFWHGDDNLDVVMVGSLMKFWYMILPRYIEILIRCDVRRTA